jgi:hypothetical protein
MLRRSTLLVLSSGLIAACSPSLREAPPAGRAAPVPATNSIPAPQIQRERGLESVIGKGASALTRRFGRARIDLSEGDARKLQFSSQNCVLDIFLYPLERGNSPVATHVEARQRAGGGDANRAQCIAEVERSARGG